MTNYQKPQTVIWVKHSFKGTHNWPEASKHAGKGVVFLESRHRHTFYVKATVEVFSDDRDIEFFVLQKTLSEIVDELYGDTWDGFVYNLGKKSCEMIAKDIASKLDKYTYGYIEISVSEDNEVGAIYRQPKRLS